MAKKKSENYLDFIPIINSKNDWSEGEDGIVTIHMVHRASTPPSLKRSSTPPESATSSWTSTAAFCGSESTESALWASWPSS